MKSLPKNPDLEFLKKDAKALRKLHRQGDAACCDRIRQHDTAFKSVSDEGILATKFSINDAQRIIAREYGYPSWATLKHYIESLTLPLYNAVADKQAYHQGIVGQYDRRSAKYDDHVWAREWSYRLVDLSPPRKGEKVLDVACGSGFIAFYIADMVGPEGSITGIDISTGMINRCNEKLRDTNHTHLDFRYGDEEELDFPPDHFDRMYCSAGLYLAVNPQATLRHWYELLKPGGELGFTAWPGNSFVWGDGARRALRKYGIQFTVMEFSGTEEKTRQLAELAGFTDINIHVEERGRWMEPDQLKGSFSTSEFTAGQYPDPLEGVPEETLRLAERDFDAMVKELTTEKGVWHDMTTFFVYCKK